MRWRFAFACLAVLLLAAGAAGLQPQKLQRLQAGAMQAAQADAGADTVLLQQEQSMHAEEDNEIVKSLKALLEEKKASGEAARAKLEAAAQHTLAVEAALQAKQKQLQSHSAMLARLEQCLQQGPASSRFEKMEQEAREQQQSLLEAQSGVQAQQQQLAEAHAELEAQQEALEAAQAEIAEKEQQLAATEAKIASQQSLLEAQATEVAGKEAKLRDLVAEQVEAGVQAKLFALRAELEAKAEDKLRAVRSAMEAQTQSLLRSQEVMLMERAASRIARKHEMKALTSVDDSPYVRASDQALMELSEQVEPVMLETFSRSAPDAKPAAPGPVPAPSSNATMSAWARKLSAHCATYDSCESCGGDGRCAWCASEGAPKCMSLDVNANLRPNSVSGDGLTSGQCSSDHWQTSVASRLTLLTLNVFASERGNSTRRFAAIVQLIKKTGADVVALQEVEKWFVHALQAHSWMKNNFHMSDYGPGQAPGGLFILSRYPIASVDYFESIRPGQVEVSQRARVLLAKLGVKGQALYVANTQLDYRSSENRAASLEFIFRTLKPFRHVFLMGDFNFDEGSKLETAAIPASYLDLWPTLVPDRPGWTWDPRSNWFAAASDPLSRASRIDRVFLRSNQWMPRSINLVGCSVSDPLCGAKNLDPKKGVALVDANKLNPALILAAPTNDADKAQPGPAQWGTKIPAFLELEQQVDFLRGEPEHEQVLRALEHEQQFSSFVELGVEVGARGPKPTFEPNFVPSNHFGLLVQTTQFAPRCPTADQ